MIPVPRAGSSAQPLLAGCDARLLQRPGRLVPRLRARKLKPGNRVAPIWAFANGDEGQRNVVDTVPGRKGYTPLWAVRTVTWKAGASARVLRSAAALRAAANAGEVTIAAQPIVVNCPVL